MTTVSFLGGIEVFFQFCTKGLQRTDPAHLSTEGSIRPSQQTSNASFIAATTSTKVPFTSFYNLAWLWQSADLRYKV